MEHAARWRRKIVVAFVVVAVVVVVVVVQAWLTGCQVAARRIIASVDRNFIASKKEG